MRSRKKKYLYDRLDDVGEMLLFEDSNSFYDLEVGERYKYIDLEEIFGDDEPVYLEIGCGKGGFVNELCKKYPDNNYIAVEKTRNIIVSAMEQARNNGLEYLKFLNCDAYNLKYVLPKNSIDRIYLNFSCPYPKGSYANNRLTNPKFLEVYKSFMKKGCEIHQKTDSKLLFDYSIEQFLNNGFGVKNVTEDLHKSGFEGNIITEYEDYFVKQGKPIYRLEAYLIEDND